MHLGPIEHDRALGHLAALGMQQVRDRLERGGLAGAVGAEQRHDAAARHLERDALEHQNDVIVDDLDVVDRQDRRGIGRLTRSRASVAMPEGGGVAAASFAL